MQTIRLGQLFGGQSRDDVNGKQGSFIYSEGVDNVSSLQFIQVSRKPKKVWSGNEKVSHILECNYSREAKNTLIFGWLGNVWNLDQKEPLYKYQANATNYEEYIKTGKPIYKYVAQVNGYVRYFAPKLLNNSDNKENRGDYSFMLSTDIIYANDTDMNRKGSEQLGDGTFYSGEGGNVADRILTGNSGMIKVGIFLYIYIRFDLYKVNTITGEVRLFNVSAGDIAGITYSGIFRIYEKSGTMYLWDGLAENPSQSYDLEMSIEKIGTMKGLDYIVSKEGVFFVESIYSRDLYRKNKSFYVEHEKFSINLPKNENIISSNGMMYLLEKDSEKGYRFVVFGSKVSGAPMSYTVWHRALNYKEVTAMAKSVDGVYVAYEDYDGSYGVDFYNFYDIEKEDKQEEGYVILREHYSDPLAEVKKSSKLTLFVDGLYTEEDYIIIDYCADRGDWVNLCSLDMNTILGRGKKGMGSYENTSMNKQFNMIAFRIKLKGNAKLYTKDLSYE